MNLRIRMLFPIVSLAVLLLASPLWAQDSIQLPATGHRPSPTPRATTAHCRKAWLGPLHALPTT